MTRIDQPKPAVVSSCPAGEVHLDPSPASSSPVVRHSNRSIIRPRRLIMSDTVVLRKRSDTVV